jgi:predicted dehydrogenase
VDELLEDPAIVLCVIATPNDSHRPLAERCLKAGRHVVIDKPFALSSADAKALAALASERELLLSAYHNRRWDGDFQTIRTILESGRLGRPVEFISHFDRYRPQPRLGAWRENGAAGGGILFDLGPHLIDQAIALFGDPSSIWADVRQSRENALVDDAFDILLSYDGSSPNMAGLRVWLSATLTAANPAPRFTLHGTLGSYVKRGLDPQEDALKADQTFATPGFGSEPPSAWGVITLPGSAAELAPTLRGDYRGYYGNVHDAILGTAPLAVTARDGWRVARLVELARESSASGSRLPVDFSDAP